MQEKACERIENSGTRHCKEQTKDECKVHFTLETTSLFTKTDGPKEKFPSWNRSGWVHIEFTKFIITRSKFSPRPPLEVWLTFPSHKSKGGRAFMVKKKTKTKLNQKSKFKLSKKNYPLWKRSRFPNSTTLRKCYNTSGGKVGSF